MNNQQILIASAGAMLVAAAGYGVYQLGVHQGATQASQSTQSSSPASATAAVPQGIPEGQAATKRHIASGLKAGDMDAMVGRKILYYHDPMTPGQKFDKPGKSPFMDMMLVPVYADSGDADPGKVSVSPRMQQSLGVRTAVVTEGALSPEFTASGSIAFNERDQAIVQARAAGFVERLHVRATLDRVSPGQPLVDLYLPDWIAAQEEFLSLRRMQGPDVATLVDGARQRMRLAGMSDRQIALVESSGRAQARITIAAPVGGVVTELQVREGMNVSAGATLFRINGLGTVWANAEVPEGQAALLRPGTRVVARTPAVPGATYEGKVQALLPDVNAGTRTLKARVELANPGQRLAPGMFVSMQFMDAPAGRMLLVPSEAVIQTGRRTVVMLAEANGQFRTVEVQAGIEASGQTEIKRGLQAGQRVVASSQFLIDSEASLRGFEARLNQAVPPSTAPAPAAAASGPPARHNGEGKVEAFDKDVMTLSHGPIPSLQWPPMTMEFKLAPGAALPANLKAGDSIGFEFFMEKDGTARLTRVTPSHAAHSTGATK